MRFPKSFLFPFMISFFLGACQGSPGALSVEDAWARPGGTGSNSAVYFRIDNPTNREDTLLGASSAAAEQVEIHLSMMGADETMAMHPQESVPIPGRSQVTFEPGGLHVMLVDLQRDLLEGDQIDLILQFQEAGEVTLRVPVEQR
jgi:periplasmic copper chaperone A